MEFKVWAVFLERTGLRSWSTEEKSGSELLTSLTLLLFAKWLSIPKAAGWWLIIGSQMIQQLLLGCLASILQISLARSKHAQLESDS